MIVTILHCSVSHIFQLSTIPIVQVKMAIPNAVRRQCSTLAKPKTMKKTACILPTLPLEIVEMICNELNTQDLTSLMGTCRDAYRLTIRCLAERYTEIYTDFSQASFDHIHAIASNKVMREYVQRLVILTCEPYLGSGVNWKWSLAGHVKNTMDMAVIKRFRDDLVSGLVNCRSFIISPIRPEGHLYPDGEEEEGEEQERRFNPDDAACILLDIISDASLPPKIFWYGRGVNYTTDIMNISRLPKSLFSNAGFRAGWGALENLHLEQGLTPMNYSFIMDMITHAPNVRKLYLSLGPKDLAVEFFSQLSRSSNLPSNLERVTLSFTAIEADDLINILYQSRHSLQRLILDGVAGLSTGWLTFLAKMKSQFPVLQTIDLNMLYGEGVIILFPAIKNYPSEKSQMFKLRSCDSPALEESGIEKADIIGITYTGPEMGVALDVLLKAYENSME